MTQPTDLLVEIEGFGPILETRRFHLPAHGFVFLEGLNGSGKSTALAAVQAAAGGDPSKLRHSNELPDGRVTLTRAGATATLTVGRRAKRDGTLVVHGLAGDVDPSKIVDPGILDPEAADLERARYLCAMAGVPAGLALFTPLLAPGRVESLSGEQAAKARGARSLPETGKWLKLALETASRTEEQLRDGLVQRAQGLTVAGEGLDLAAPCDEAALAAQTESAVRALAEQEGHRQAAAKRREAIAAAQRTLDDVARGAGGLTVAEAEQRVRDRVAAEELLAQDAAELDHLCQATRDAVVAAQRALDESQARAGAAAAAQRRVQQERAQHAQETQRARNDVDRARAAQDQLAALRAQVEQGAGDPGPADETLAELRGRVDEARRAQERGVLVRAARVAADQAAAVLLESQKHDAAAAELRGAAAGVWDVIADAVTRAAPEGVRFRNGRLVCDHPDRGTVFFAELSAGERWRKVLPGCIRAVGAGGILTVCQEGCEALDPVNTQYVHELAAAEGVLVLGARATDGELRAEVS